MHAQTRLVAFRRLKNRLKLRSQSLVQTLSRKARRVLRYLLFKTRFQMQASSLTIIFSSLQRPALTLLLSIIATLLHSPVSAYFHGQKMFKAETPRPLTHEQQKQL